jgi:hypothetical protein
MGMKVLSVALGLVACLILAQAATAATVNDLITYPGSKAILATDQDREYLVKDSGNSGGAKVLEVNDVLKGIFYIDKLTISENGGTPVTTYLLNSNSNSEWGGYFEAKVTGKVSLGSGDYAFTFGSNASDGKTMVWMFEDPVSGFSSSANLDLSNSIAAATGTVTDGTAYWTLGLANANNAWTAVGPDDLTALSTFGGSGTRLATGVFALSRTSTSGPGAAHSFELLTNAAGEGEFVGSITAGAPISSNSPWDANSTLSANMLVVPLPGAVFPGMMMLGIVVIGAVRRRRRAV